MRYGSDSLYAAMANEVEGSKHTTALSKGSAILRVVLRGLRDGFLADLDEAAVIAVARKVWDNVVVPYDIPRVPNFLETRIEAAAWKAIEGVIKRLFDDSQDDDEVATLGSPGPEAS